MLLRSSLLSTFGLAALALPVKRQSNSTSPNLLVLQFANVLEQLETTFYSQALSKFQQSDFTTAGFSDPQVPIQQFQTIANDESTHTTTIQQAIVDAGGTPLNCSFDFSNALTDVSTMAATARVVEMVGVGAYLGAAGLITDPQLLTAAASILTVEARHQTMLNVLNGAGSAIPGAFDIPLSPSQVLAIAGPFIQPGCDLGVPANTPLTITNTGPVGVGTSLTFDMSSMPNVDQSSLSCQMMIGGAPASISQPLSSCIVPNISGPVAIYITNSTQPLANDQQIQFTQEIVMGPTLAFIDSGADSIMQLVRSSSSDSSPPSSTSTTVDSSASSTTTISPAEASSIIANASSGGASPTATFGTVPPAASSGSSNLSTGDPTSGTATDGNTVVLGWSSVPASQPLPSV